MADLSIKAKKKDGREVSNLYKTEIISPILTYIDFEDLQKLVNHSVHNTGFKSGKNIALQQQQIPRT